jgi:hypothetical protein
MNEETHLRLPANAFSDRDCDKHPLFQKRNVEVQSEKVMQAVVFQRAEPGFEPRPGGSIGAIINSPGRAPVFPI